MKNQLEFFSASAPNPNQAFFQTVEQTWARARAHQSIESRFYTIAGLKFRLDVVGESLTKAMCSALEHARVAPESVADYDAVDFSIGLWDSDSTGVALPPPPWKSEDYQPRGQVRGWGDARFRLCFEPNIGCFHICDLAVKRGFFWTRDVASLSTYLRSSPLLPILLPFFSRENRTLVHAGAVGFPDGGVLLTGKSGSGKSTATLSCLDSPLLYGADNYGLVALQPAPTFHSLYSSGKVLPQDAPRFPLLEGALIPGAHESEKVLYFLHDHLPHKTVREFPLRAILLPRFGGGRDTRVVPASPAQAMLGLAPSSVLQVAGVENPSFSALAELARTLPAFVLETGTDRAQIPRVVMALLEKLNREAKP